MYAGHPATYIQLKDHAAAAIAAAGIPCLRLERRNREDEYDWCIDQTLKWPEDMQPNMVLDDGGDAHDYATRKVS